MVHDQLPHIPKLMPNEIPEPGEPIGDYWLHETLSPLLERTGALLSCVSTDPDLQRCHAAALTLLAQQLDLAVWVLGRWWTTKKADGADEHTACPQEQPHAFSNHAYPIG